MHVIMVPYIMLQPAVPSGPAAHPLHAFVKAPNALIIIYMYMPSSKLKAAKPRPELAEAQA